MDKSDYRKALQAARTEFQRLIHERVALDQRIVRLKQTIASLSGLCDTNNAPESLNRVIPLPPKFMRLTSAIRQILADSNTPMRPPELRRGLLERGLNMAQYANQLAVIHNTLARLEKQGEVTELAAGWMLTEKGKLASRMDALDFIGSNGDETPSGEEHASATENAPIPINSKPASNHKRPR